MSDISCSELLQYPEEKRNQVWEKDFLSSFKNTYVKISNHDPQPGPDNWPYLLVESTDDENQEPVLEVLNWLSDKGIGLCLNAQKDMPDYVFTYGMIWNFRQTGSFVSETGKIKSETMIIEKGEKISTGEPSEEYLPPYAKKILRDFLVTNGAYNPRVLMVKEEGGSWDLCFAQESLGNPKKEEHQGIAEAISWFLPLHYSIAIVSGQAFSEFKPL